MARALLLALIFAVKPPLGVAFVAGELAAGDRRRTANALGVVGCVWYAANAWLYGAEFVVPWARALAAYPGAIDLGWWRLWVVGLLVSLAWRRRGLWGVGW